MMASANFRSIISAMARLLIIGGTSHRALTLTKELTSQGYAVRAVTRNSENRQVLEEVGAEYWLGDPNIIGTIRDALDHVTVLCWLLGNAVGSPDHIEALHGSRLRMMLERSIDTTVRGFIYEANGNVPAQTFAQGCKEIERARTVHGIPCKTITADLCEQAVWQEQVKRSLNSILATE